MPLSPQIAHIENTYKYTQGVRQGRQTNSWRRSSRWTTALGVGWIMDSEHGESVSWCGPGSHDTPCSISCAFKKNKPMTTKKKKRAKKTWVGNHVCEAGVFSKRWPGFRCTAERCHKQGAPLRFDNGGAPAGSAVIPFAFSPRPNELDRWLCHPNPWLAIRLCRKQYNRNRAGESLQEVETAALLDNAAAAAALHPPPPPHKITLVKLNSENEFNIKWVTAGQSVIRLKPLSGAACMAYELIRHVRLH